MYGEAAAISAWRAHGAVKALAVGIADVANGLEGHPTVAEMVADSLKNDPLGLRVSQFGD